MKIMVSRLPVLFFVIYCLACALSWKTLPRIAALIERLVQSIGLSASSDLILVFIYLSCLTVIFRALEFLFAWISLRTKNNTYKIDGMFAKKGDAVRLITSVVFGIGAIYFAFLDIDEPVNNFGSFVVFFVVIYVGVGAVFQAICSLPVVVAGLINRRY